MKKKKYLVIGILACITVSALSYAFGKSADNKFEGICAIYNSKGERVSFHEMLSSASQSDVCLFGEYHGDPISHWLEFRLLKGLYAQRGEALLFGGEMWERDQQDVMDECMKTQLVDMDMLVQASPQWDNFDTSYRSLLEFCRKMNIPVICTNIPRRYASLVSEHGDSILHKLSNKAKQYFPPLPIPFDFSEASYLECAEVAKTGAMSALRKGTVENMVKAQAVKDAAMAHWIAGSLSGKNMVFHINGELHSGNHSGICYYLRLLQPRLRIKTISVISLPEGGRLSAKDMRADFIVVIPEDMGKV